MRLHLYIFRKLRWALSVFLLCLFSLNSLATICYVKPSATGTVSSWADASGDLQLMINISLSDDQICVAAGNYKPIRPADNLGVKSLNDRDNAFLLKKDVKIYWGFLEIEAILGFRNWEIRTTTLSGNIGVVVVSTDNCYHFVISSGDIGVVNLDEFTISEGRCSNLNIGSTLKCLN